MTLVVEKKRYWKLLRKLENNEDRNSYIPDFTLVNHFKELLQDDSTTQESEQTPYGEPGKLDHPISVKELEVASKILKNGKGTGIDAIRNEMISPLVATYPKLLLRAFNSIILSHKTLCKDWLHSLITCIHKKGAKDNPDNYRGISLMSCIGKLFLTIINNRLVKYSLEKGLLSPGQLGFVIGNRTSDPHTMLQNLVQKYCHKKNLRIFACFVDFSKAFDTVPRNILLRKLREKGIDGRILEIIKTLYLEDYASVKIGKKYSPSFKTNIGVRQGCVLSPLLFNIFLADLQPALDQCQDNVKVDENIDLSCLLWADDILMFSESEKGLQDKINKLDSYCKTNKLTVNTDKTQCMVFNKSGRLLRNYKFKFRNTHLKCVREYKYLGFLVTPSGEIRSGLEDLRVHALKAFAKMKKALGMHFRLNITNSIHIFNYTIKPILLYCSDFWGCLKQPKNNPIERLFMSFCKQLLGVRKQTHTDGVLQELGLLPIKFNAIKMAVKNWERIHLKKANSLLIASHVDALKNDLPWETCVKNVFATNGLLDTYITKVRDTAEETSGTCAASILFKRLADQFNQTSMESIKTSSKMKTLSLLKDTLGRATYLEEVTNPRHRQAMSKLRLSGHNLEVERGRYSRTPGDERICKYCKFKGINVVEDEAHFLLDCSMSELRDECLPKEILDNKDMSREDKLVKILTYPEIKPIAKFIFKSFEHREITLDVLNTIEDITQNVESLVTAKNPETDKGNIAYHIKNISSDGLKMTLSRVGTNM